MDMNALTTAWLGAVVRTRSAEHRNFVQQIPQAKSSGGELTLTDVITGALQDAGAKPTPAANAPTGSPPSSPTSAQLVDLLV